VDGAIGTGGQSRRARGARISTGTGCGKITGSRKGDRKSGVEGGGGEGYRHRCAGGSEQLVTEVETHGSQSHGRSRAVSAERKRLGAAAGIVGNQQRSGPRTQGRRRKGHVDRAIGTGGQGRRARGAGTCTGTGCRKITGSRKDRKSVV